VITIERRVGRLVEATMRTPTTLDDIDSAGRRMAEVLGGLPRRGVICADFTQAKILLAPESEALARVFRHTNEHFERSAVLVSSTSATSVLQMERVIREAENPARRAFREAIELVVWLSEILDAAERERIHAMLAERIAGPPSQRRSNPYSEPT